MIDFNDPYYTQRSFLTKEGLLLYYSDYDYLKGYFPELEVGQTINSPFRTDKHPSFSIYYSQQHNCILYKDLKTGEMGDFVLFIQKLLGIVSYKDTLAQIAVDFGLESKFYISQETKQSKKTYTIQHHNLSAEQYAKSEYQLQVKIRPWNTTDSAYWNLFGITIPLLEYYQVCPIQGYFHNGFYIETPHLSYVFIEYKDNKLTYKVYRPFADKRHKWRTNHSSDIHQGYKQLVNSEYKLIITKSLKDVMSLRAMINIPAVAIQAETINVKTSVMAEYYLRFYEVYTLFDNDEAGKIITEKFTKEHNTKPLLISNAYTATTDFSDLVQNYGKYEAQSHINRLINNSF